MAEEKMMLEVTDLVVHYETDEGIAEAVNGISFTIEKQKTLGLVGETGAGKTTTALSLLRLLPEPQGVIKRGSIKLEGRELLELSEIEMDAVRGQDISMIFQDPMTSLNPVLTVGDQIAEVMRTHEDLDQKTAMDRAGDMLELVGIPRSRREEYPHQFSGGMKQRVVIAIALACSPKLLIADEPTTALDVTIQSQILEIMKELKEKYKMSMLMITHDLGIVAEVCDEVAVLYAGRIVEQGTVRQVFKKPLHPYTEGLFGSLPDMSENGEMLRPIPGLTPDPMRLPKGCSFAPRCPYAMARCREEQPVLKSLGDEHPVACLAYEDPDFRLTGGGRNG